jgi:hypothetical protein
MCAFLAGRLAMRGGVLRTIERMGLELVAITSRVDGD